MNCGGLSAVLCYTDGISGPFVPFIDTSPDKVRIPHSRTPGAALAAPAPAACCRGRCRSLLPLQLLPLLALLTAASAANPLPLRSVARSNVFHR